MIKVEIGQNLKGTWFLVVSQKHQVINLWTFRKLIEAIEMACALQLHVDNVSELPLTQYLNQGV